MRPVLALTLGDPAGIGPEIVLRAAQMPELRETARLVAVGSADAGDLNADAAETAAQAEVPATELTPAERRRMLFSCTVFWKYN